MHVVFPPLPVVIPLAMAALLSALSGWLPRRLLDLIGCLTSAAVLGICCFLCVASAHQPIVYWFGGWKPSFHFALGISFVIDPIGAGMAALVALLVLTAFVFSWRYFEQVKSLFHAVMLVFLAAMCGLCLTGDLFNMFVWFELMSAAGIILCGYKSEEYGPLQGALNFAVVNTLGAYLTLTGIGIIYASVGALNFAQISSALTHHDPHGWLLPIAFLFIISGFLVKAAAFPFHFWLADAHAVAPTPVCILFSGVMVELGLYAVARIYWSIFAPVLSAHDCPTRALLLTIGTLTAIVGGIECFGQRHLKRLLAFSTISHVGLIILGLALLDPDALAGAALYVIGHGMVKASLFICAGILLHRFRSVDEYELFGRGRKLPWTGLVLLVGALGLAGVPPFSLFFGEFQIDDAADKMHLPWIAAIFMISGILTSGAVLRVGGRIFLGIGARRPVDREAPRVPMDAETKAAHHHTPWIMWTPAMLLLVGALIVVPLTPLRRLATAHADRMMDTRGYTDLVLLQKPMPAVHVPEMKSPWPSWWKPAITIACALLLALSALFPDALGEAGHSVFRLISRAIHPLRALQSGRIGDYVAWFILGIGAYGIFLVLKYHAG